MSTVHRKTPLSVVSYGRPIQYIDFLPFPFIYPAHCTPGSRHLDLGPFGVSATPAILPIPPQARLSSGLAPNFVLRTYALDIHFMVEFFSELPFRGHPSCCSDRRRGPFSLLPITKSRKNRRIPGVSALSRVDGYSSENPLKIHTISVERCCIMEGYCRNLEGKPFLLHERRQHHADSCQW